MTFENATKFKLEHQTTVPIKKATHHKVNDLLRIGSIYEEELVSATY